MLFAILLFGFFAIGVKVVLALAVLYALLPARSTCAACDGETVALRSPRGARWFYRAARLQQRWCPACGLSQHARDTGPGARVWVGSLPARGESARTVRARGA